MPLSQSDSDDAIYVALEALQCSPEEIAEALGIDVGALWRYYDRNRRVPNFVQQRLMLLLQDRALLLRDLAVLLSSRELRRGVVPPS